MTLSTPFLKVYQGVADRRQMYRMFDRHAQRPASSEKVSGPRYAGEWFKIGRTEHDHMFEILPPLWIRYGMFALREFLTDSITSVFFTLKIDDGIRWFHGYCDLADKGSPDRMRDAIIERETRPVRAMTCAERIEHIWSSTHDEYRGYADWRFPHSTRGKRIVIVYGTGRRHEFKLLDELTDTEITVKLPVHLRYLPSAIAA